MESRFNENTKCNQLKHKYKYKVMKKTEKQAIKKELIEFIEQMGSQNKAAKRIGVSNALISQIINDKWGSIKDDMWRHIRSQITVTDKGWNLAPTSNYRLLTRILSNVQSNQLVAGIVGDAGCGKTSTVKQYAREHKNVYTLHCSEFWNRKYFLSQLLRKMGMEHGGLTVAEMMMEVITALRKKHNPLVILDEADKLPDQVLHFFITLYNELEDSCGLVLIATNYLKKRITRGVNLNRRGYKEIYSRIGRSFIELRMVSYTDVLSICHENGIADPQTIKQIWEDCENDIRRVKRSVIANKMILKQAS